MLSKMRVALSLTFVVSLCVGLSFRDARRVAAQKQEQRAEQPLPQPAAPPAAEPAQELSPQATVQIFGNNTPITINDNSTATPYPSTITVSGVNPATVTKVQVTLIGFTHTFPDDVDVILVGPQGQRAMLMSDAGGSDDVSGLQLTFSQTATTSIPDATTLATGTYRPANYGNSSTDLTDSFPGPAPAPGTLTDAPADLSMFNLIDPNGVWSLYVVDDAGTDVGTISGGWLLALTVPTVFMVNSVNDPGNGVCDDNECTLREAINAAIANTGNSDLINFSPAFNTPQTINLQTALPDINESMTINGPGAHLLTVRRDFNATTDFRIFNITNAATNGVAISGMTIAGGRATGFGVGGGILSRSNLTLTNVHVTGNQAFDSGGGVGLVFSDGVFTGCTFSGNTAAAAGGGIYYQGDGNRTLRLVNSTVSGNSANNGGGIYNLSASNNNNSRLEVVSSTITGNTATDGGGIRTFTQNGANSTATTTLRNSIIAGNTANNLAVGTAGGNAATFQSQGFNLSDNYNGVATVGTDIINATPRLAPLALYGGQTPTHALLGGSPAIDAGNSSGAGFDQRGRNRPFDVLFVLNTNGTDGADIGAVEMSSSSLVTNTNDSAFDLNSLRGAIIASPTNSDILFEPTFFNTPRTITLGGAELVINKNLNIIGTGANLLTVSGNTQSRVFNIDSGFTASLSGMTITGGNGSNGGGILNNGMLTLTNSIISGNTATTIGGGVDNRGTLAVTNSTISGNTVNSVNATGGGIDNTGGTLTITNSTISDNHVPNGNNNGGGIWSGINPHGNVTITNSTIANNAAAGAGSASGYFGAGSGGGTVTVRNSIIAGNVNNATQPDVVANAPASITSNGFNLIGNRGTVTFNQTGDQAGGNGNPILNPLLGVLQNNGGTTQTHALFAGSTALDRGNSSGTTTDQRGSPRPFDLPVANQTGGDGADIGAFEAQTTPPAAPTIAINDVAQAEGNAGTSNFNFTVTLSVAAGSPVTVSYQTADGTATAPADYTAIGTTTLTFNAGETSKQISVAVVGDTTLEPSETFFVNLANPTNATIADNQGQGTIQNDDSCPTITINPQLPGGTVGTAYSQTLAGVGGLSPYTFAVTAGRLPNGLTLSSGGAISGTPTTSGPFNFTVTATDANGCTGTRAYSFSVTCPGSITLGSLANGTVGTSYNQTVAVSPAGSYTFAVTSGALPNGLTLNTATGNITGTPTVAGSFSFTLEATAPSNCFGSQSYNVTVAPAPATLAFSTTNYNVGEGDGRATIFVIRSGDTSSSATVDYRTQDTDTFTVGCADAVNNQGGAYGRCDFATAVGTLAFAAGQTQQQFTVPIINDAHVEGMETFSVQLSNAVGASLGTPNPATITILDNDVAGQPNPVYEPNPANTSRTISFFVRQQYLDFLSREPEQGEPWSGVLTRCLTIAGGDPQNINNLNPNSPSAGCDRILVSLSFFGSPEFQLKGFYVFRFYKLAYNRLPEYLEIIPDMSFVAGQTPAEVFARKAQLATLFTQRTEFVTTYGSQTNAQYVNALLARYQLTQITTPDPANPDGTVKVTLTNADLLSRLNASTLTRAQVFRAIADSDEVNVREFNNAFVGMQYYGYLRRKPEPAGYQSWLTVLQSGDQRTMVNGFLNSIEYRLRFGTP